jgi:colanic acid/amylovoran biosynthesis glycosyltransferase
MRICVTTEQFPRPGEPWIYEPIAWLRERGHDVRVIARTAGALADGSSPPVHPYLVDYWLERDQKLRLILGSPIRAALSLSRARIAAQRSSFKLVEVVGRSLLPPLRDAAVLLAQFGEVGAQWLPVAAAARLPYAVYFHGFDVAVAPHQTPGLYAQLFASGASLITNGNYLASRLMALGAPPERISIVRYPVPPEIAALPPPGLNRRQILTIARLMPKKGLDDSLRAFALAQDVMCGKWTYDVIGEGRLAQSLVQLAGDLGISALVRFRGVLARPQIFTALHDASMFVLASKTGPDGDTEGTPVALMEAATAGLPVVTTQHAGNPDCVPDSAASRGYLVAEGHIDGLAAAMRQLASDPGERQGWGEACRTHVRARFTADLHVQQLVSVLEHAAVPSLPHAPAHRIV